MGKLSKYGKEVFETQFCCDSLKDFRDIYFPENTINEIIKALNSVGKVEDGEIISWMKVFFEGLNYGKQKTKTKLKQVILNLWSEMHISDEARDLLFEKLRGI